MRVRAVGVVALMALVLASCGGATSEAAGPSEGIQVHGDWTIDIFNEDGTLDEHVEFSNALTNPGAQQLTQILAGESTPGVWTIKFGQNGVDLCPSQLLGLCHIAPTVSPVDAIGDVFRETLRLEGSTEVEADGAISLVRTSLGVCPADTAPNACTTDGGLGTFTAKDPIVDPDTGQPYPVSVGQVIQIRVDISFTNP